MKKTFKSIASIYLILLFGLFVLQFFFFKEEPFNQIIDDILSTPSLKYLMGTDSLGRDLFWRVAHGGQVSILVGILTTAVSVMIGLIYGSIAGLKEGYLDSLMMRFVDIISSIPSFVTASVLCIGLQYVVVFENVFLKSLVILLISISLTHWMNIARVVRALVLETKHQAFIESAKVLGATSSRIFWKHILPNIRTQVFTLAILQIPTSIMYESYMSFIGLGIQAPFTSWGMLIQDGWKALAVYPHLVMFPALCLFLTVWSVNTLLSEDSRED